MIFRSIYRLANSQTPRFFQILKQKSRVPCMTTSTAPARRRPQLPGKARSRRATKASLASRNHLSLSQPIDLLPPLAALASKSRSPFDLSLPARTFRSCCKVCSNMAWGVIFRVNSTRCRNACTWRPKPGSPGCVLQRQSVVILKCQAGCRSTGQTETATLWPRSSCNRTFARTSE